MGILFPGYILIQVAGGAGQKYPASRSPIEIRGSVEEFPAGCGRSEIYGREGEAIKQKSSETGTGGRDAENYGEKRCSEGLAATLLFALKREKSRKYSIRRGKL